MWLACVSGFLETGKIIHVKLVKWQNLGWWNGLEAYSTFFASLLTWIQPLELPWKWKETMQSCPLTAPHTVAHMIPTAYLYIHNVTLGITLNNKIRPSRCSRPLLSSSQTRMCTQWHTLPVVASWVDIGYYQAFTLGGWLRTMVSENDRSWPSLRTHLQAPTPRRPVTYCLVMLVDRFLSYFQP